MGDRQYPYPVALHWTQEPESLKKLKNKLLLYFQKRSESNGGECEIRDTDCSRGYILIHYKEGAGKDPIVNPSTKSPDILSIVEKFSRNSRVRTLKMTAQLLEETKTIRVEGLPPETPEDLISLYFESPKHGGSGTNETLAISEEGAALVTFSTVEAAKKVLGRKHQFSKKDVSVYPYYPSQDIVLYGKQRPHIQKPEPLTFPINPYILEFIVSNAQQKDNMETTMEAHTCEIKWPDLLCPNPEITLNFPDTLSTHLRTLAKLVPTWNYTVHAEFSRLISKYKVIEYKMDQSVWDAIREHVSSSTYNEVLIKPDIAATKVFLAGFVKDVTKIDPTFRQLVEETTKQVVRKNQGKTETLSMSPALYQIMCNSGLKKKILDQVPELKIDYDVPRKEIRLSGLRDEVLTAKCEILDLKQEMKSKSIQMNPHLVQFLTSTDNEELSCLLFVRHNMNALLEIDDDNVKLTAYSKKDLVEAEEQMKQELVCKEICVEEKSVLNSPEWRSFHSYLLESCNAEKSTVLILETLSGAENNVVIAGLSSNVGKCYQQVSDFLEENTPVEKNIQCKSLVVIEFLKEEKKQVLDELKSDNLSVAIRNKNIRLKGPKPYVSKAYTRISDVLRSLFSDTLYIDKPGAKKFCLEQEDLYITMAKNTFRCLLRFQKEEEEETEEDETEEMEGPQCQVNLPNGVVISVHKDDLCRLKVDVIVNAANEELKHIGGLAAALLRAAGPKLQEDSDHIVKTEGKLSTGESVATDSGRLPCKQIIHTVGPRWNSTSATQCDRLLQKAITSSLALAEEYCHSSIAIPAVSSGIFGCPVDKSAENIIQAIKQYMANKPKGSSTIKEIHLVDTNENTVRIFASTLKKEFGEEEAEPAPQYRAKRPEKVERPFPKERVYERNVSTNQMMTKENIVITTDAVVNSVGNDLRLSSGGASKALLDKAGDELQQCLNKVRSGAQVEDGSVFITEGCNLSCKTVIHVVVPRWDGGNGSAEKIFREVVRSCLCESEKRKMRSITFPAIGTGVLGFPKSSVATFMFEEILKFSSKSNPQHLREVCFILHPSDKETISEFSKELSSRMDRNATVRTRSSMAAPGPSHSSQVGAGSSPGFFGTVSTPVAGTHEMKVGSVTYQVKTGDVTKEDTDVIVNSTDKTFTMRSGVSKAILDAAGQSVVDECTRLGSQGNKEHIVTQNGNLRCKKILHRTGAHSATGIKHFITEALTECAGLRATSVAFPACVAGVGSVSSSTVADSILESVADFAQSPQSVQTVKVVIFQKQMLNDFYTSMKKKEGNAMPKKQRFMSTVKNSSSYIAKFSISGWNTEGSEEDPEVFELSENIEPAIIHLCAESRDTVDKTKSWFSDLMMKEQNENLITDDWIRDFDDKEQEAIVQLQKEYQVSLIFDLTNVTIKVLGLSKDVLDVSNKIHKIIKTVRDKKTRDREAELCSNLVEWGYLSGSNFIPFDKMANLDLEKAKNENTQCVSIDINGVTYTVIVEELKARDARGNTFKIQRNSKHAACFGNGTYFAVNANYSADDTYSRPDGNGYKYMYLSRVVTGVSCVGHQGMIAPPPKVATKPTDLHDSATNDLTNPVMYVIFHDIQAYPEYLFTFTK
ncbi:PREDICTED: poly [ADP-ribose] polymerase 14-like [Nanorana parkeri]|uniref:poly [ADP-ribose] polymerase 14-like n=1 Tax=Nanorana parkeri TaxID=125878 RepID=UPI0008542CAE|nr:PREDICTED: poly [ADP-ribose] polymerase 14-like [Nanorana parkeri]